MEKNFDQGKKRCLSKADLSKKASVDEDIVHLVSLLNSHKDYFTTSSCSGRITVMDAAPERCIVPKKDLSWLFVSHRKCKFEDVTAALDKSCGNAVLKFEPFVLHVRCRRLDDAQFLLSAAVQSGFRNSGITLGKTGKIMMAVRCTHGLEVPLSKQGSVLVSQEYIQFLIEIANEKMEENLRRIERFYQRIQTTGMTNRRADREEGLTTEEHRSLTPGQKKNKPSRQSDYCQSGMEMEEDLHLSQWLNVAL
ncbi:tRNA wybutosine-synthesizing protein 3 homolog [Stigmatopora nigra]